MLTGMWQSQVNYDSTIIRPRHCDRDGAKQSELVTDKEFQRLGKR